MGVTRMSRGLFLKSVMAAALAVVVAAPAVQAADLGGRPSYKDEPDYGAPRYLWTGVYAGLQAGYAWGDAFQFDGGGTFFSKEADGFIGGGTLGYNFQRGQVVWGIETDFSGSNLEARGGCTGGPTCETTMDWLWTLRGRVGLDMNGWMPYVTGGLAMAEVSADSGQQSGSDTLTGWTIGGGLEVKLDRNWSLKGEYLYVDVGDSFNLGGGERATLEDLHIVRGGINYKF
jgi:outer membrane immunogenic protein